MDIKYEQSEDFRGNVYIVKDDRVVYEKSTGFADYANEIPNDTETKFATASAGKAFVAVGILQLIEAGKLRFDTTLKEVLDISYKQIDPSVTIRELLNHTSGVPDYFDESVMEEYEELWVDFPCYRIRHNKDLLPLFVHKPMMYPRGERFQYNNTGYVLLAMVIESVTGMEFDEYLQKNVFSVCGMKHTGYYEMDRLPAKCANSYIYEEETDSFRTNIFCVDSKGTGAGGAFTTVKDVVAFWNGIISHRLISEPMVNQMFDCQAKEVTEEYTDYYGYGFWLRPSNDGGFLPHFEGCDPGVSFITEYNKKENMITVIVSNYGDNVWKEMHLVRTSCYE